MKPASFLMAAVIVLWLILPQAVLSATSLGSVAMSSQEDARAGGSVTLGMLVFSSADEEVLIRIESSGPDGWEVTDPGSVAVEGSLPGICVNKEGYECLSTGAGDVMARTVYLAVQVPDDARNGHYEIDVTLSYTVSQGGMTATQSRTHTFMVNVLGGRPAPWDGDPTESVHGEGSEASDGIDGGSNGQDGAEDPLTIIGDVGDGVAGESGQRGGGLPTETPGGAFIFISLVIIFGASVLIYKR